MRILVGDGIYRARGALLRTMETVVAEKPLSSATSRMVMLALGRRLEYGTEQPPFLGAKYAFSHCSSQSNNRQNNCRKYTKIGRVLLKRFLDFFSSSIQDLITQDR